MVDIRKIQTVKGVLSVSIPARIVKKLNLKAGQVLFVDDVEESIVYKKYVGSD